MRGALILLMLLLFLSGQGQGEGIKPLPGPAESLFRPVALTLLGKGDTLLVANRDSGSISEIDLKTLQVRANTRVGQRLSGLAAGLKHDLLLVADEGAGAAVLLRRRAGSLQVLRKLKTGISPAAAQLNDDASAAMIACLWPRRILLFNLAKDGPSPDAAAFQDPDAVIDLPFAPRSMLVAGRPEKLIVADAFGGNLAVVDVRAKKVESVRSLSGHNIRGLALDRQRKHLLITHQSLNPRGHTVAGDIRAGNVVDNHVRKLLLSDVLDPWADITRNERVYPLGDVERGAGDPAEVAESYDGHVLVTLGGVNELAIGRPDEVIWTRLPVGRRPTALAVDHVRRRAYVANTFADSISVVDLAAHKIIAEIRLGGSPRVLTPEQRGELLFYDARLSLDGWYSCHSCHPDGHTNGRLNDNFTDGSFGTPKRVLSLLGVKDTGPWAWNGQFADLEGQVGNSLTSTMQGPKPSPERVRDLTAFLKSLAPPPSVRKARGKLDPAAVRRGKLVFTRNKCGTCHVPPTFTSPRAYDVGLRDEAGGKNFNPPSLRGLSQAGPYFHDNRALTLDEIFGRYNHELPRKLSEEELRDLVYFLDSL